MEIPGDRNMEGVQDDCAKQLLSSCYPDMIGVFGDSELVPRVGPEYQAEIPPLVEDCCRVQLVPAGSEFTENAGSSLPGMPIPRMWSKVEVENINEIVEFENSEESHIISNNEHTGPRFQTAEPLSNPRLRKEVLSDYQLVCGVKSTLNHSVQKSVNKIDQAEGDLCPLQDSLGASWEDVEHDSFLLALYIFGKNLSVVKRFVGSKEMEDILSFYYGQFYRSKRYRRWADCRKSRSRCRISGSKIFSGWRQQELLSRLFSQVSLECQGKLLEAAREYGEGKTTLEEYVFALKGSVGVQMLVQAVGIGKGKQDLTGTSMEKNKSSNSNSMHPEIPIGKACSFLTSAEIIKFLTGGFRLSKARSSDLFWEAVWPRLLAGGWHSEQPKDSICSSKSSLVFLVPGVKKFSRRKLVKGNHYFDSVSDVLNKVASEPGLLELENGGVNGNAEKEERGSDVGLKREKDHLSDVRQPFYLQPPHLNSNCHIQKFMIIDTSVVHGAGRPKLRELRSLPVITFGASASSSISSGGAEDTSDESQSKEEPNTRNCAYLEELAAAGPYLHSTDWMNNHSDESIRNAIDSSAGAKDNHKNKSTRLSIKKQPRKAMKYRPIRKAKPGSLKYICTKPQFFASGHDANSTCIVEDVSAEHKLYEDDSPCTSTSPSACEDMVIELPLDLSPISCLVGESADGSEDIVTENFPGIKEYPEKVRSPKLVDLNVPDVSADSGADTSQKNDVRCMDPSLCVSETREKLEPLILPDAIPSAELQSSTNSRRQSTRNRPLTMKALENLELGFFDSTKKRKGVDIPEGKLKRKSTRRIRENVGVEEFPNHRSRKDSNDSRIGTYPNCLHDSSDMVGESQV